MIATCFAFALLVVPASGAVRFAEPGGNGPSAAGGCPEIDPCGIEAAIEGAAAPDVLDGDEIRLLPGNYNVMTATLTVSDAITIHPRDANTRPTITGTASTLVQVNDAATLSDLTIENLTGTGLGATLFVIPNGALVERVAVETTALGGSFQSACSFFNGTLRDSTCMANDADGGPGFVIALASQVGGGPGNHTARFINVTAHGTGSLTGLLARSSDPNVTVAVTAHNVITPNVLASTESEAGSTASVSLTNSNYQVSLTSGSGTSSTPVDAPTNQSALPLFVDAINGDFHQLAGSPTINAGAPTALLGTLDLDFQARIQGSAPDIGADEFVPPVTPPVDPPVDPPADPPDTKAPTVTITSKPKPKVKTKKKTAKFSVGFSADETATFRCSLDGKAAATCSSPFTGKVKKGRHTVSVAATDAAGNASAAAEASWTVKRKKPKR